MAQLFPRLIRVTIGASALAAAMGWQPLTAAPATGQTASAKSASNAKRDFRQDTDKGKRDKAKGDKNSDESKKKWTKSERRELVKRAQVWAPTDIASMDLRLGPQSREAFRPDEEVTCDYVYNEDLPGTSRKFNCAINKNDVVKVRYGEENGKVEGEVLGTRLLWALGFGADAVYPVKVRCRGCSADPWVNRQPVASEQYFEVAAIERKFPGEEIKADKDGGWSWKELRHVDEQLGGAPVAHLDAMRLLAVFIQHTDNKIINERFVCLPGGFGITQPEHLDQLRARARAPFLGLVHQVGEVELAREGEAPVLVTSSNVRPFVRGIVERFRAQTPVLSQGEIHPRARLKTVSSI
jgi:hypothetical protein